MKTQFLYCLFTVILAFTTVKAGDLTVFPLFTDHGILQQDTTVAIWGTARPGSQVSVSFCGVEANATADETGAWLARLQTPTAIPGHFEGYDLTISSGDELIELNDVAVGEVWIGGGQSNIDTEMTRYDVGLAEIPHADYPGIRLYSCGGLKGKGDFSKFSWVRCSPDTVGGASAAGYFFSRDLHNQLSVPVGFINMAVGGSPLSAWVLPEWLSEDPRMAENMQVFTDTSFPAFIESRKRSLLEWENMITEAEAKGVKPERPWRPFKGPAEQPMEAFVGKYHVTHAAPVMPFVFKGMVWDQGESGVGYQLRGGYDIIFKIMLENLREGFGFDFPVVYCEMPKGGAWGPQLHVLLEKESFQKQGNELVPLADLPVSAPKSGRPFDGFANEPDPSHKMNAIPGCFMATSRDLAKALHPPDKDDYGSRFYRVAFHNVYGGNLEWFGPMIKSAKREGNELRVSFDHVGTGLVALGGKPLQGFYVTDASGNSVWVSGRIDGEQIVFTGPAITNAESISYANTGGGRVMWANFFNRDGLPGYPMTVSIQ